MLKVKTKIQPSRIEGIGLFADQFIAKGTITWQYTPRFDLTYTQEELDALPEWSRDQFSKYSYFDKKIHKYVLCVDDQRFINHSIDPNIISTPDADKAGRDIKAGEELVCNYTHYESDWFTRRGIDEKDFTYIIKGK